MELGKYIESALRSLLRDPIVSLLRQIGFASILKQSNFTKRSVGISPYPVVFHKGRPAFVEQSGDAFGKDLCYGFLKQFRSSRRKLLRPRALHDIDDTVESRYWRSSNVYTCTLCACRDLLCRVSNAYTR
jgi:hypothetical protein